jgi:membrane protein implicated in regulation of membrane protease activity
MEWWLWLAGGLALVVAELATPSGFFIIFFGAGALTVGALKVFSLIDSLPLELLLFSALSIAYLMTFRGRLRAWVQAPPAPNVDSLIGVLAIVQESLSPGVVGKVEVRGSMWSARNTSDVTLTPGQRARVSAIDGLLLAVVPE